MLTLPTRRELFDWWRALPAEGKGADGALFARTAEQALDLGEPLLALDICRRGLSLPAPAQALRTRLLQLEALALARSGAASAAHDKIEALIDAQADSGGAVDSESLGLLARTFKDLWRKAATPELRATLLKRALSHYEQAHFAGNRSWAGVNVATLRLAAGRRAEAEQVAGDVLMQMNAGSSEDEAWTLLTKAECHLVTGNAVGAKKFYASARLRGLPPGRLSAARRNAAIVLQALGRSEDLEDVFPRSEVIVFAGHRADAPGRPAPRLASASEAAIAKAIRQHLVVSQAAVAVACAADGADILFHEAMLERGGEVHVVLPSPPEAFVETSVAKPWRTRFEHVLSKAASVTVLSREASEPVDFSYASRMLLGFARVRSAQYDARLTGLAVWDGEPGLPGGTGTSVHEWMRHGVPVAAIDPADGSSRAVEAGAVPPPPPLDPERRVAALLFADAQGFSKLSDEHVSVFTDRVLAPLGASLDRLGDQVLCRNTWGDALYVAFADMASAAHFGSEVVASCSPARLVEIGLPDRVKFRVSLHAGPVREVYDPVSKARNFIGTHVSWAARIEPITPPGSVYSSEAFAALCALDPKAADIECAYVGHVPLAKGYATLPTYNVTRR